MAKQNFYYYDSELLMAKIQLNVINAHEFSDIHKQNDITDLNLLLLLPSFRIVDLMNVFSVTFCHLSHLMTL